MHQDSFGSLLADARRQCNYTVEDVARTLRIRPDIVLSIEREDLHSLPPRAYTRNMISRYARLVRVDSDYILKQYDTRSYSTDISDIRLSGSTSQRSGQFGSVSSRPSNINGKDSQSRYNGDGADTPLDDALSTSDSSSALRMPSSRMSSAYSMPNTQWERQDTSNYSNSFSDRKSLSLFDEDDYDDRGVESHSHRHYGASSHAHTSAYHSSQDRQSSRPVDSSRRQRVRRATQSAMPDARQASMHASRHVSAQSPRSVNPLFFVIAGILVIVLVIVIVAVTSSGTTNSNAKSNAVPISGLTDTASESESDAQSIVVPVAPTSVEFAYSVDSGAESYIEIYLDGSETPTKAEVVSGPSKESYTVTGKLRFVCTQPDGVKVSVDGTAATLTSDSETSWMYVYEIDFAEYLAKWQEEHAAEIAAAQKAKEELLAAQAAASSSPSASSGTESKSSSSGKTTTTN